MLNKVIQIIIFGYGIGILYTKSDKECNPSKDNYNSDGSVKKFNIEVYSSKWSNPQIIIDYHWNYSLI